MKVVIYASSLNGGVTCNLGRVQAGFARHGIKIVHRRPGDLEKCDLAVCWGVRRKHEIRSGRRSLIVERAYVGDRFYWTSIGYDGLNGRADFCNKGMDGKRWDRLFSEYIKEPVDTRGNEHVLLIGQVPGDMSLANVSIRDWYVKTAADISRGGHQVVFRPHPNAKAVRVPKIITSEARPLSLDLKEAKWVVTYNSNTAVDAVLAGIPTVTMDVGSMAYSVTGHTPAKMPTMVDRQQWCHDLAYTQWSPDEIERGEFWDHLKGGMNG